MLSARRAFFAGTASNSSIPTSASVATAPMTGRPHLGARRPPSLRQPLTAAPDSTSDASGHGTGRGPACVVLAAGRSRRLRTRHGPKPLAPVLGLSLLERTIVTAAEADLSVFYVVTGFDADRVERHCADLGRRHGLTVVPIRSEHWRAGNGASTLAASQFCRDDDFVLLMGDHLFDPELVRILVAAGRHDDLVACADFRIGTRRGAQARDATKLQIDAGRIVAIGKDLDEYNAYDAGIFWCSPTLFSALESSIRDGDASLAGGIRHLAHAGRARALDIGDRYWLDVDTRPQLRDAKALLRQGLGKPEDGFIARTINRPISTRLVTPALLRLLPSITPIEVSFLGVLAGALAGLLFFLGLPVGAGIVVMLASILDGSDGEIARLKRSASSLGRYVDAVFDRYADALILVGASGYAWSDTSEQWMSVATWRVLVVLVATLAITGHLMVSYTSARAVVDLGHRYHGSLISAGRGRDLRLFVMALGGVLAIIDPISVLMALGIIAALSNGTVAARLWVSWRQVRRPVPDVTAVIFDLDGTLADTMPLLTRIATEALEKRGLSPDEARQRYLETVGLDFASQLEEIFPGDPANEQTAADFEDEKRAGILSAPLFPDTVEMLSFLSQRNIKCFAASSTTPDLVAGYLAHTGLDQMLDDWTGYARDFDKRAQVEFLVRTHDLDPRRVLFVADAPRDFGLVESCLVPFVGVRSTFGPKEFRSRGLDSVADLGQLMHRWTEAEALVRRVAPSEASSVTR